jgi:multidrug efflux pump
MARFFIDRPVFAWVLAIATMLMGVLAIRSLPINQYPNIAPPPVNITVTYPGASAADGAETRSCRVIEQQLNGLDGLRYMSPRDRATATAAPTSR